MMDSRPPPIYPQVNKSDISSAPSSMTLQSPPTPGAIQSNHHPTSRPSSGPGALQSHHVSLPPANMPRSAGYPPSFHTSVSTPGPTLPGYSDFGRAPPYFQDTGNMGPQVQMSATGMQNQKRAYRQRRKDPSCDACRERKVKCDANDSSSCTECSSRNVKCQFTKETNRRMSNIRHNQDLQKELAQAKSQVSQLRSMLDTSKKDTSIHHASTCLPSPDPATLPNHHLSHLPDPEYLRMAEEVPRYEQRQPKRRRITYPVNLLGVGTNIERYGHGIFKPPYPRQGISPSSSSSLPVLPPKEVADALMRHYYFTLHPTLPMLHWPSFKDRYDIVYSCKSLHSVPRIWVALLYAVFACGTLHRSWRDGEQYLQTSRSLVDLWTEDLTLDHARTALLTSIFLVELNLKSAGWISVGHAVRVAFDLGLHCEAGNWSAVEEEMRRRVWWCIYTCDCLLSLELGRPSLIKEEDCDVQLPSPVDDRYMHPNSNWLSPTPEQSTSSLPATIQVIGGIAKLLRLLKSRYIAKTSLQAYDSHFKRCMQEFPVYRQIRTNHYVDPIELPPVMYLQNARLMLHRHNLNPTSSAADKSTALDRCASTAAETANLLRRCMQETPPESLSPITEKNDTWEKRMVSATSAFFCTHVWRCALYLCFRFDFENAIYCARASATLGASRPINVACGRYMEFFLTEMVRKFDERNGFDTDEEMIAYVSGDLQGNFKNAWVWKGGKVDDHLEGSFQNPIYMERRDAEATPEQDVTAWDCWDNILNILDNLFRVKRQEQHHRAIERSALRPPLILPPLAPSPPMGNGSSRMSIKDLI